MKINYKSDFDFILKIKVKDTEGNETDLGFPPYDFKAVLRCGFAESYAAFCKGGVMTNCYNDNGEIHVVCNGHKLGIGTLSVEFFSYIPNEIYPDGEKTLVTKQDLDIELTRTGYEDNHSFVSELTIQAIKGDKGDKGDQGEKGEKGDKFLYSDFTKEELEALTKPLKEEMQPTINYAKEQGDRAKDLSEHPPIIKDNYWYTWDGEDYIDTGVLANGGLVYPKLEINEDLELVASNESKIELNEGELIINL